MNGLHIYVKDKHRLYAFENESQAAEWFDKTKTNPESVIFITENPLEDLIIAKEEVKTDFSCGNCNTSMHVYRHPKETSFKVKCPVCGGINAVEAPDVSTPPGEGDEY